MESSKIFNGIMVLIAVSIFSIIFSITNVSSQAKSRSTESTIEELQSNPSLVNFDDYISIIENLRQVGRRIDAIKLELSKKEKIIAEQQNIIYDLQRENERLISIPKELPKVSTQIKIDTFYIVKKNNVFSGIFKGKKKVDTLTIKQ